MGQTLIETVDEEDNKGKWANGYSRIYVYLEFWRKPRTMGFQFVALHLLLLLPLKYTAVAFPPENQVSLGIDFSTIFKKIFQSIIEIHKSSKSFSIDWQLASFLFRYICMYFAGFFCQFSIFICTQLSVKLFHFMFLNSTYYSDKGQLA